MSTGSAIGSTTANFVSSLISNIAIAGAEIAGWTMVRRLFQPIYEPRSYMPQPIDQSPPLKPNLVMVYRQIWEAELGDVLIQNGVDAYVYLIFLRMCLKIFIPVWLLSWAVLLPLDAVRTEVEGKSGLDKFTLGNIATDRQSRLWGHLVMAWIFTIWICYIIRIEMSRWVTVRQRYLISERHSITAQASTVLVTGIPGGYMDEERLAILFRHLPGGVRRVWLTRNLKEMPGLYNERVKATKRLESAQVKLTKIATKIRREREEAITKSDRKHEPLGKKFTEEINTSIRAGEPSPSMETLTSLGARPQELILADHLVPRSSRPRHRLAAKRFLHIPIPFTGEKVDTIDWARKEIVRTTKGLEVGRERLQADIANPGTEGEMYPPAASAFVQFNNQLAAHMASEILLSDQPFVMSRTYTETSPDDIIWSNLDVNSYEANVREAIAWAATLGIVFIYTFPSAFIGALSNVTSLCAQYPELEMLCTISSVPKGILEGIVPPILSAVINQLIPIVFRQLGRLEGIPKKTQLELSLMTRMAIFTTVNTFIITTLSSGLIVVLPAIAKDPASIPNTLATQLPQASTFFLTYVMLQAAGAAGNLLQPITLLIYCVKLLLLGGTPRSVYSLRYRMNTTDWGTQFPSTTIVCIIVLSYMIISPIINGLATAAFTMLYFASKYNYTWTTATLASSDTGGLFFPKAIDHLFIGLYIGDVSLCALFFLARDERKDVAAVPQGALMIVLIVFTAAFHYLLSISYSPLRHALPLSLADMSYGMRTEKSPTESIAESTQSDRVRGASSAREHLLSSGEGSPDMANNGDLQTGSPHSDDSRNRGVFGGILSKGTGWAQEAQENAKAKLPGFLQPEAIRGGLRRRNSHKPSRPEPKLPEPPGEHKKPNAGSDEGKRFSRSNADLAEASRASGRTTDDVEMGEVGHDHRFNLPLLQVLSGGVNGKIEQDSQMANDPPEEEQSGPDGDADEGRVDYDRWTFLHPAVREPQHCVWLPHDLLDLGDAEARDNKSVGIFSSTKGATLNYEGKVAISSPPPDDYHADTDA